MVLQLAWRTISILHANDAYASTYTENLRRSCDSRGLAVRVSASYTTQLPSTYGSAVNLLRDSGANIILGVLWDEDMLGLLQLAQEQGMVQSGYVWFLSNTATLSGALSHGAAFGLNQDASEALLVGIFTLQPSPVGTAGFARFAAEFAAQNLSECTNEHFNVTLYPTLYTPWEFQSFVYDCVVAMAIAMARAIDPADGEEVYREFKQVTFDGASGPVAFDPTTGDRGSDSFIYVVQNWQRSGSTVVGQQVASVSVVTGLSNLSTSAVWPGGRSRTPIDLTTITECDAGSIRTYNEYEEPTCSRCPLNRVEFQRKQCIDKVGTVGLLMPITDAGQEQQSFLSRGFLSLTCAAKLAVRHVNEHEIGRAHV